MDDETPANPSETPSTVTETPSAVTETPSAINETPSVPVKEASSPEEAMDCEDSDCASSSSSSSSWEVETLTGFGGLRSVKDVDEYGRETDSVASQRCELSVLTTFAAGEAQPSKAKLLSLDGLLEYTRKDTREKIFEVSLLGEVFKDMLMVRFGQAIGELLRQTQTAMKEAEAAVLEAREAEREAMEKEKEKEKEGEAETNKEAIADEETIKETSVEEKKDDEPPKETLKETPKETVKETPKEAAKELGREVQAAKKSVPIAISRELFIACRYFDGKNRGELSQEQLLHILLNSGAVCCKSEGEKLVTYVLDRDSLRYRKLYKSYRVF